MSFNDAFEKFPVLKSSTVLLRELKPEDAEDLHVYYSDEELNDQLKWSGTSSVGHAREIIEMYRDGFEKRIAILWGIIDKQKNTLIGTCTLAEFGGGEYRAEIGYDLSKAYWGKGLMTEILKSLVIPFGFRRMGLKRIQATVSPQNAASIRVLGKLGFQQEGLLRNYFFHEVKKIPMDAAVFSITCDDYFRNE